MSICLRLLSFAATACAIIDPTKCAFAPAFLLQHLRHRRRAERALPVAADAHDGAVGAHRLHQAPAATAGHAASHLPNQRTGVSVERFNIGPKAYS